MLIRYSSGCLFEAIILSLSSDSLRVARKDADDVLEFRLVNGVWLSEDLEAVTFDFTMAVLAAVGIVPPADRTNLQEDGPVPARTTEPLGDSVGYLN
jgi:hypothetical protein